MPLPPWMASLPSPPCMLSSPPLVGDDVVAGAAEDHVVAVAAFEPVVAAVAIERVVANAGDEGVVARRCRRARRDPRRCMQVVRVGTCRIGVVADHQRDERAVAERIGSRQADCPRSRPCGVADRRAGCRRDRDARLVELPRLDRPRGEGRRREHVARQVGGVGVRHDQLGERVVLELGEEVEAGGAFQVVEAVAVLQLLHLVSKTKLKVEPSRPPKGICFSARPPIHRSTSSTPVCRRRRRCAGSRAVQEGEAVVAGVAHAVHAEHRRRGIGGRALAPASRGRGRDRGMRAVGGDEVDERFGVLQVLAPKSSPARVRLELAVAGHRVELGARLVERRHAGVAAAREVDGRQVERQADEVVAQRLGDELVDLVADLRGSCRARWRRRASSARHRRCAANASGFRNAAIRPDLLAARSSPLRIADDVEARVEAVDRLGQHRVAEAIDDVRELGDDRRIDRRCRSPGLRRRTRRPAAEPCARTPRTRGADTASRCRSGRPGTGARRPTRALRSRPA